MDKEVEGYEYTEGPDFELWASVEPPAFGVYHSRITGRWEYYCVKNGRHSYWHCMPDNQNITSAKERIEYARALSRLED